MNPKLKAYAEHFWSLRRENLGAAGERADRVLAGCNEEEKPLLQFVLATLPLSDLGDYEPEFLLGILREALAAREAFSWCAGLPDHLFLLHVLYPRINTEQLSNCRGQFRQALEPRVKGLSLEEAILEVNRWCAENVTYRSTDERTASAEAIFGCCYGRCGEESTFAVTALRSVGIAARQVYSPWWSHCDDNHAWVEAWDGKRWRYLGACEPEPVLDRGWFTAASSRAMRIHGRCFLQGSYEDWGFLFPDTDPVDLEEDGSVVFESVTGRYAEMKLFSVLVQDEKGQPLSGVRVTFSVLNMAALSEIAVRKTGQDGKAVLRLGAGSVHITAEKDGLWAEKTARVGEDGEIVLQLSADPKPEGKTDFEFLSPDGAAGYPAPFTPEQKRERREVLDRAGALRAQKAAGVPGLLREEPTENEQRIRGLLTKKDRAWKIPRQVLEDAGSAFAYEAVYPSEVFEEALLSPRIALEPLAPWRRKLASAFSEQEKEEFRRAPEKIWGWVRKNIREDSSYPALSGTPAGIFRLGAGNRPGQEVLFCALCRAFGIPARLSPLDGEPEFWQDGGFRRLTGESSVAAGSGKLLLKAPGDQAGLYRQNFCLFRQTDPGAFRPVKTGDVAQGGSAALSLEPGSYRLITVNRLSSGNQLAELNDFTLAPGEEKELLLEFRAGDPAGMLECLALPPFTLQDKDGNRHDSASLLGEAPLSLVLWLEAGREPTEHILNELREAAEAVNATGCPVHFILEEPGKRKDPTLNRALELLPGAKIWYGDFQDTASDQARRMFVEPEVFPLILLIDSNGNGLFVSSGYNVGTATLLVRLIREFNRNLKIIKL